MPSSLFKICGVSLLLLVATTSVKIFSEVSDDGSSSVLNALDEALNSTHFEAAKASSLSSNDNGVVVNTGAAMFVQPLWCSVKEAFRTAISQFDLLPLLFVSTFLYLWLDSTNEKELITLKMIVKKSETYFYSILFMITSKDKKGLGVKGNKDPDVYFADKNPPVTKRFIFIRHGESDWNSVFNKGLKGFLRLIPCIISELFMWHLNDSKFLDSPLNQEGIEQAEGLRKFLDNPTLTGDAQHQQKMKELIDIINGTKGDSIIVASNLRRAIATTCVGLWSRITRTKEKIVISSHLQEISPNVDTYSLAPKSEVSDLPFSRIKDQCPGLNPAELFDCHENKGNKTIINPGMKRFKAFGDWAFRRPEETIIVGGHSLWFKSFFETWLPHKSNHSLKKDKIPNSGVYSFTAQTVKGDDGTSVFRIDPASIIKIYEPPSHK